MRFLIGDLWVRNNHDFGALSRHDEARWLPRLVMLMLAGALLASLAVLGGCKEECSPRGEWLVDYGQHEGGARIEVNRGRFAVELTGKDAARGTGSWNGRTFGIDLRGDKTSAKSYRCTMASDCNAMECEVPGDPAQKASMRRK